MREFLLVFYCNYMLIFYRFQDNDLLVENLLVFAIYLSQSCLKPLAGVFPET